jgi:hypothetical protein
MAKQASGSPLAAVISLAANDGDAGEYRAEDYFEQLDGLRYKEVISFADSTGPSTALRYARSASAHAKQRCERRKFYVVGKSARRIQRISSSVSCVQ